MTAPSRSRHLLAPELAPGLEFFPKLDFSIGLDVFRNGFARRPIPPLPPELEIVRREDRPIPGPHGAPDVPLLIYTPPGQAAGLRPAVLDIHGGGYIIGSADMSDASNRQLALDLDCVVVSVEYRLAPETAWPGARDDCYAALCWLHAAAAELGIDPARIAVSGVSAGAGHAAALAIHARNLGGPSICFQLLDSPMLDDRTGSSADPHPFTGEFSWSAEHNRLGWQSLLGTQPGGDDVPDAAVPARVSDLSGLPPAFILIGGIDLFLDESLEYARRLSRAGVPVELHLIPGAYHGFGLAAGAPQTLLAKKLSREAMARALGVTRD